jgi:hypothetical protein
MSSRGHQKGCFGNLNPGLDSLDVTIDTASGTKNVDTSHAPRVPWVEEVGFLADGTLLARTAEVP